LIHPLSVEIHAGQTGILYIGQCACGAFEVTSSSGALHSYSIHTCLEIFARRKWAAAFTLA